MSLESLQNLALLFGLGLAGWFLLARIRFPAPEITGPIFLIGALRVLHLDLPDAPNYLFPVAQITIGIFVGSMLDKKSVQNLKPMATSALVVVTWALTMIVIIGFFLNRFSVMDPQTALLSASMGGLPEISVLAVASGASAEVVIFMQLLRMLGSIILFPAIIGWIKNRKNNNSLFGKPVQKEDKLIKDNNSQPLAQNTDPEPESARLKNRDQGFWNLKKSSVITGFNRCHLVDLWVSVKHSWVKVLTTLAIAVTGGFVFLLIGIPAGLMVGSTFFIAAASIAGVPVSRMSKKLLSFLLVAIGVTLAGTITPETIQTMARIEFLLPILIATTTMFISSFAIAVVIYRMTEWDFPTSFLAAAPGGFSVMTALAIKYDLDPFKVSMVHLCRLLAIKMFVPLTFLFLSSLS